MKLGLVRAPLPAGLPNLRDHAIARAIAPAKLIRDHVQYRPAMDGNDCWGNCTCAAVANAIRAQAALADYSVDISTQRVLDLYAAASGWVPGNPATDRGALAIDVLGYQLAHGFCTGGSTAYVGLWANIEVHNFNLMRLVMARMGIAYLGLALAEADQAGGVWDTGTPASQGNPTPGSWGGHAALCWSYAGNRDDDLVQIVTWGRLQPATWRWVRSRLEESHALFHPQMLGPNGNYAGLDRDRLVADLASYGACA